MSPRPFIAAWILLIAMACVTTPDPPPKTLRGLPSLKLQSQTVPRVQDVCYCGWAGDPGNFSKLCAAWRQKWRGQGRQRVLDYVLASRCEARDCAVYFSGTTSCLAFETWPNEGAAQGDPSPAGEDCFCDYATVSKGGARIEACALWRRGDRFLREYHILPSCGPSQCLREPFVSTKYYCPGRLIKFH